MGPRRALAGAGRKDAPATTSAPARVAGRRGMGGAIEVRSMLQTLQELASEDPQRLRRRVGGKAAELAGLVRAGLPVPPALVLPAKALSAHLRHHGLTHQARAGADLSEALTRLPLHPALRAELRRRVPELGPLLAVRSSGIDEDGADASFAGQYRTVLGVRPGDAVEDAIRACWASAWSARARAYRRARLRGRRAAAAMGVVIQALVDPECAGVLFTIDPTTGSWREMTVEAAWGQGEAVVSGLVVPEFHRVRRPRRSPPPLQRLLARMRLQLVETVPARQDFRWTVDESGHGLVQRPVPPHQLGRPCLDPEAVLELCRLGLRVEGARREPVDVEWARDSDGQFWLLQARPVTAGRGTRRAGPTVWTRRFVGERWTRPATPLGWSLMRELLEWFIAYPETSRRYLGGAAPTRMVRFAPYFNVTVFRHLAFKLPGRPPPRFMVELLPEDEERGWLRSHAHPPDLRVYRSILGETLRERRWQRFRWNLFTNWKAWEELRPRLDAAIAELSTPIRSTADALARTRRCEALAREYVKVHICSLLFANIWYQLAEAALNRAGHARRVGVLLNPPADSPTVQTNRALWRLGRGALSLDEFLAEYGHRADGAWELFSPRWCEDPERVRALAAAIADQPDPGIAARAAHAAADRELQQVHGLARAVTVLARRYLALREEQRFTFDRLAWQWKRAWLWLEDSAGLSLRFLEAAEARSFFDGELSRDRAEELITRRRAEWEAELRRRAEGDEPPVFIIGDAAAEAELPAHQRLEGMGISSGVVTGPVRVVRSLEDAHRLRPGDILVTRATDPAWTPLFLNAAGLVMELGGMLSHGAVVAREYGLPAVVNVTDATRRLHDGQTVTLDGRRGIVWIR
ncbi:MAG: hypothetical protein D6798_14365 [Deltaproteobacteria bacterium]|nr:MAG: hypothetical protein D6798_14365 [Deltaproteobacteria bacterium]